MTTRPQGDEPDHTSLEARIAANITPAIEHLGYELVRVLILGRERPTVQMMADRADGAQISVEDCERISHAVSALLDVDDPLPGRLEPGSQLGRHRPPAHPGQGLGPLRRPPGPRRAAGPARRPPPLHRHHRRRRRARSAACGSTPGTTSPSPSPNLRRAKLVLTDALIEATASNKMAN